MDALFCSFLSVVKIPPLLDCCNICFIYYASIHTIASWMLRCDDSSGWLTSILVWLGIKLCWSNHLPFTYAMASMDCHNTCKACNSSWPVEATSDLSVCNWVKCKLCTFWVHDLCINNFELFDKKYYFICKVCAYNDEGDFDFNAALLR